MKKCFKLFNILLLVFLLVFTGTSCKDKKGTYKFNFDDKYFIGMQEHFYEIRAMEPKLTTDFICDLNAAIGSKLFRLNVTLNNLFFVDVNDTVKFNQSVKEQMRVIVDKLIASGVERIVYATDSFVYPYGYSTTHTICAPDPYTEKDAYIRWLKVQAKCYEMMATEFPEIKYYEVINEPDIPNNEVLCKNGMLWGTQQAEFMFSAWDEANILVDLCYYERQAIKKVSKDNVMLGPALSSLNSTYEYLTFMYEAIESGAHPICEEDPTSVDPDDYFDALDLHPYSFVAQNINPAVKTENGIVCIGNEYVEGCKKFYDICCAHGDAEKPHWYTEIGFTDQGSSRAEETIGREALKQLETIKKDLPFVECVIFYKMTDQYEFKVSITEDYFGLMSAVANPDRPLEPKPIMKTIYSYIHNGSTDYSAFDALRAKYCNK